MKNQYLTLPTLLLVFALCVAGFVAQSDAVAAELTAPGSITELRRYLVEAGNNNRELRAAHSRWRAAAERAPQVSQMPDPTLSFGYFVQPVETRTGPQRFKYGIKQKLPWYGKLGLKELDAVKQAEALKARAEAVRLKVFYSVKKAYFEYAYLAQAIRTTRENIVLMEYLENVARTKYAAGAVPYTGVLRTQVELDKLKDRLATLKDLRRPMEAKLQAAMNRNGDKRMPLPDDVPIMELVLDEERLPVEMMANNPRLKAFDFLREKEQAGIDLAEKEFYPDFTIGLESIYQDESRSALPVTNEDRDPIIASLSFNLPLWREGREAAVREAKTRKRAVEFDKQDLEQQLRTNLELALYQYRDAGRKLKLYSSTLIPKAEQTLVVSLESFQAGSGGSLDFIDAEKTLIELQLAYHRALADRAQRFAEMEMLVGRELECRYHGTMPETGANDLKVIIEKAQ